jgi:hypothetical protein
MPTTAQCYADYKKCLGTKPSQAQQVACTFKYIQCVLGTAEAVAKKELKRFEKQSAAEKPKAARKRRAPSRRKS